MRLLFAFILWLPAAAATAATPVAKTRSLSSRFRLKDGIAGAVL